MTDTTAPSSPPALPSSQIFYTRLAIGLAQGLALYLLYRATENKAWPATNGLFFGPFVVLSLFVPLIAIQALGTLRRRTYVLWLSASTLILAFLAWYDIWHAWPVDWDFNAFPTPMPDGKIEQRGGWVPHIIPSMLLLLTLSAGLFIAHTLITGGDKDRKFMASYPTHFDVAWKHGIQIALTCAFVGAMWLFLFLGASLFGIIKLKFLSELIKEEWFYIPVSALATAAALHLTDINVGLIRGVRTLALTLLSWLLPLLALIVFGFLIALPFTGVTLLWDTGNAAALMLIAAACLLILINAVYREGGEERVLPLVLRYTTTLSMFAPVALTALAAYAIHLRINQYGWTSDRVLAFACVATAAFYSIGYFIAAIRRGAWLSFIESWNFYAALFILALLVSLFSPIADPMRISVNSQMSRLDRNIIKAIDVDYFALRWDGGRFGKVALERFKKYKGDNAEYISKRVENALTSKNLYDKNYGLRKPNELEGVISVLPKGAKLPQSFLSQDWSATRGSAPECITYPGFKCVAQLVDLDHDGKDEIIISDSGSAYAFKQGAKDNWSSIGKWETVSYCKPMRDALQAGQYHAVSPLKPSWPDLEINGRRFAFQPFVAETECQPTK